MLSGQWPDKIAGLDTDEFISQAEQFHGHLSPGVVTGGFMVDAALKAFPPTEHLNAVVESVVCLPDAVQLLTPCTLGNSFMQVLDWGKFAVTLYDRESLEGVRVWLDLEKVKQNPIIAGWYVRKPDAPKLDREVVIRELFGCGCELLGQARVRMKGSLKNTEKVPTAICPQCGESYPIRFGNACAACGGQAYYDLV